MNLYKALSIITITSLLSITSLLAHLNSPKKTNPYWPNDAQLVISISMQFEASAQGTNAPSPFPAIDTKYVDTIKPTWYQYGMYEGIPRLLNLWDKHNIKVTSHMVGRAVELNPELAKEVVDRGHEASGHGQTWDPQYSMTAKEERASYI
jgi:peptidoglycan/xylan/chitin deacetylase (PgdA/CDA1 family)